MYHKSASNPETLSASEDAFSYQSLGELLETGIGYAEFVVLYSMCENQSVSEFIINFFANKMRPASLSIDASLIFSLL